jgi:GTP cyclohydrolase IA
VSSYPPAKPTAARMHLCNGSADVSISSLGRSALLDSPFAPASPRASEPSSAARAAPSTGVDRPRLERAVREILLAIGEDPDRDGLHETPARAAKAWIDLSAGSRDDAARHLGKQFAHRTSGGNELVAVRGVEFYSLCEHHLLPFFGRAHVAYLPANDRVCGLSKVARTVDVFARRLQMQERLTAQIADAIVEHLAPVGVAVVLEGAHMCMRMRGAAKSDSDMLTTALRGVFDTQPAQRAEVLSLLVGRGRD